MREYTIRVPTLHPGQARIVRDPARFKAVRCGRRWGKTWLGETVACDVALKGGPVGWFAPDYKIMSEVYDELKDMLEPVIKRASQTAGLIKLKTGGRIDFWTLDNPRAGRSRKYKLAVLDEAAFTKPNVKDIWKKSIRPTLVDLQGRALALSNTNGVDDENFFWRICNDPKFEFTQFHAPTRDNPYMPQEELDLLQANEHPLVFKQEYEAEFVDWTGVQFFEVAKCLDDAGQPVPIPDVCDVVFATIDTGSKTGIKHDGTAVMYWALVRRGPQQRLYMLDWDIAHIEGSLLENWLPTVFENLKYWSGRCRSRFGTTGAFIEDQNSGTILLQQAKRRNWAAHAIDSDLTAAGKDGRALSVSGYVYRGLVKITRPAYEKATKFKEVERNHMLKQVFTFKIGVDNEQDDLLDTFTYGAAIALGDSKGH